jgi:hypothetical protein
LLLVPLLYVLALERPAEAKVWGPADCDKAGKMDELCLRNLIKMANEADKPTVAHPQGEQYVIYLGTNEIKLSQALPAVFTKNHWLNIIGDGATRTTIRGPCPENERNKILGHCGPYGAPVFQVWEDAGLVIDSITVTNGDPGIINEGYLYVYSSTIAHNGNHSTAGVMNLGPYVYLQDSTVNDNVSHNGPGGGISNVDGFVEIVNSTIHSNRVSSEGIGAGGIWNGLTTYKLDKYGYPVKENGKYVVTGRMGGTLSIANSTIYGNVVDGFADPYPSAGGIVNDGTGVVWLGSVTITNNYAVSGNLTTTDPVVHGVFSSADSQGLHFFNTIIARNGPDYRGPDCDGTLFSLGGNLVGSGAIKCDVQEEPITWDTAGVTRPPDVKMPDGTYNDPGFVEPFGRPQLRDNGGNSCTVALNDKSRALNRGWKGAPGSHPLACAEYDQRGARRNRSGEWTCDPGAYEWQKGKSTPSGLICPDQ